MDEELVAIARIAKSRGLRGELVGAVLTDFPERFDNLERVFAVREKAETLELEIEKFWFQKGRVILKFKGFDSIETAETLRNATICVPESEAVELETDEYFDWELRECNVETVGGAKIGKVREILRTGGTEVLVVEDADDSKKDYLIPFAEKICVKVDIENRIIKIDAPDGLLDF
jgi:16S rRNA processing protein RimM